MKISDRDKKLILIVLLAAIILLPIFLFVRPKNEEIKGFEGELVTLNERYNYLKDLDSKRPFYESEITRLNDERKELVKGFSKGILQENTIMFLRDVELDFPISIAAETFGAYDTTVVDSELTALSTTTGVAYSCEYAQIKDFLDYIFTYPEKMTIPNISIRYNSDTGVFSGSFDISEFAFINEDDPVQVHSIPDIDKGGNESIFTRYLPVVDEEDLIAEDTLGEDAENAGTEEINE